MSHYSLRVVRLAQRLKLSYNQKKLWKSGELRNLNNQTLGQFLSERTAKEMKRIEEEIHKEVSVGICEYFGSDKLADLTENQIMEIKEAQKGRERGFVKLGYNLVLKQLS